jgi:hypothetical protein
MAEEKQVSYREQCFAILRILGCPESIAKRMITGTHGEQRTDVRRADESFEDFLHRTNPARYERMLQRDRDRNAYRHGLNMAKLIGEQVRRDIKNFL